MREYKGGFNSAYESEMMQGLDPDPKNHTGTKPVSKAEFQKELEALTTDPVNNK